PPALPPFPYTRSSDLKVHLPKTTVYRILATLVARGFVWRDPLRRVYCLGARTIELARKAYAMPELVAAARAELKALRDLTGETRSEEHTSELQSHLNL